MCKSVHQVTKVTLSHFQQALELTQHQDYQITYDLNVAYYHHTKIYWTQTKFLGADISKPNGETQCFISLFLPLRLSSAVHCITKILKPINGYLHEKGVRHLRTYFFYDDRVTAVSECKAEEHRVFVYDVLRKSGFIIEAKKSDQKGEASQCEEYLGFIIDTSSMTVRLGETKKQLILRK